MAMAHGGYPTRAEFAVFVADVEPRLRRALVETFGPVDGREATVDALSWAWEHWGRLLEVENRAGYLYRVGQSAVRRFGSQAAPESLSREIETRLPDMDPGLFPALERLSAQQRTVVLLVHAHGWSQAEAARTLGVNPSTVREHLERGMDRLRHEMEVKDVN